MCEYKIYPPYSPLFPLPLCLPTSHWYPSPEKTYFSILPFILFFECILIIQGAFTLVPQAYTHHALIKLTSTPHYLCILFHHEPLIFNRLQYGTLLYSYIEGLFRCFSSSNIFFPSPVSHNPPNTYIYIYIYIYSDSLIQYI
jgi:hypothetical protein